MIAKGLLSWSMQKSKLNEKKIYMKTNPEDLIIENTSKRHKKGAPSLMLTCFSISSIAVAHKNNISSTK